MTRSICLLGLAALILAFLTLSACGTPTPVPAVSPPTAVPPAASVTASPTDTVMPVPQTATAVPPTATVTPAPSQTPVPTVTTPATVDATAAFRPFAAATATALAEAAQPSPTRTNAPATSTRVPPTVTRAPATLAPTKPPVNQNPCNLQAGQSGILFRNSRDFRVLLTIGGGDWGTHDFWFEPNSTTPIQFPPGRYTATLTLGMAHYRFSDDRIAFDEGKCYTLQTPD